MDYPHPHSKVGMKQRPGSVEQNRLCLKREGKSLKHHQDFLAPTQAISHWPDGSEAQPGFQTSQDPMARLDPHRSWETET